jgi:hypothetical protein
VILKEPAPVPDGHFLQGVWHYARGLAYTATGRPDDAARELGRLQQIAAMESLKGLQVTFSRNGARAILEIAVEVLAGELAAARGDFEQAITRSSGSRRQLIYMEPPTGMPVRQSWGRCCWRRRAAEKAVYCRTQPRPKNGWALFGLMKSSSPGQGRTSGRDRAPI